MKKTKLECLASIIYEPLKSVVNGNCQNKDLVILARHIISVLEDANHITDLERFSDLHSEMIKSLWNLIRENQ